jgi:uncharacterized protein YmfQ (DUF2313 family)
MSVCKKLFKSFTRQEHTDSLVQYLPGGEAFDAKNEESSILRKLFAGLAVEVKRSEDLLNDITSEHDIRCTTKFLKEWEKALGIPDSCFPGTGSLEIRRQHVLIKLASLGVSTEQGFIDLAAMFGFKSLIPSAATYGVFPLAFPATFYQYPQDARFTMIVYLDADNVPEVFPFEVTKFPIPFFSNVSNIVECLIRKLAPANVNVRFVYIDLS